MASPSRAVHLTRFLETFVTDVVENATSIRTMRVELGEVRQMRGELDRALKELEASQERIRKLESLIEIAAKKSVVRYAEYAVSSSLSKQLHTYRFTGADDSRRIQKSTPFNEDSSNTSQTPAHIREEASDLPVPPPKAPAKGPTSTPSYAPHIGKEKAALSKNNQRPRTLEKESVGKRIRSDSGTEDVTSNSKKAKTQPQSCDKRSRFAKPQRLDDILENVPERFKPGVNQGSTGQALQHQDLPTTNIQPASTSLQAERAKLAKDSAMSIRSRKKQSSEIASESANEKDYDVADAPSPPTTRSAARLARVAIETKKSEGKEKNASSSAGTRTKKIQDGEEEDDVEAEDREMLERFGVH
ncbi:MAG: hypothetical protein M1821_007368 [Bathelium mastoideum]|nr:MAG: hypothetical protein M1821_007368 [Bathelium mastoideum]